MWSSIQFRFFEGVGLHEIYDAKDQRATLPNERDRFYYANLLSEIGRHLKSSSQPLFAYLETMATHRLRLHLHARDRSAGRRPGN